LVNETTDEQQADAHASIFLAGDAQEEKSIEWQGQTLTFTVRTTITRKARGQILAGVSLGDKGIQIDIARLFDAVYDAFIVKSPIPRNQLAFIDARLSARIENEVLPDIGTVLGFQIPKEVRANL